MSLTSAIRPRIALFIAIATTLVATSRPALAIDQSSPPNVVFILADDQGWGDFGFMGHPHIQTPNIDRLARESLVFQRGYVPDSLCRASLASIISGLYPRQHKIVGNDPKASEDLRQRAGGKLMTSPEYIELRERYIAHIDRVSTLPKRLKALNYRSLQTGKWWEGNYRRGGFDEGMTHGDMLRGARHGDEGLRIGREGLEPIDRFVQQSVSDSKPFFVWYAPMLPHTPHNPPQSLLEKYQSKTPHPPVAKYWAMCEWFDQTVGDLRKILERHGVATNTAIVFVCDNGWINDKKSSQYAARSKRTPYEGGTRTPIIIHWPGRVAPRVDQTHLASSIDLVPTVLDMVGLEADPALPGLSLLDEPLVHARHEIVGEIFDHDAESIDDPLASLRYRWIIDGEWKLIESTSTAETEADASIQLYKISSDPTEEQNLATQYPNRVATLIEKLDKQLPEK